MNHAIVVFIAGVSGVACAMALLYVSIRITGKITDRIVQKKESDHA